MEKLSESEDMRLFETMAIKKLIEYLFPIVRYYTIKMLLVPYILFICFFSLFMHFN